MFHNGRIKADFKAEFPGFEADAERRFSTMETINTELFSGTEDPEPPYDMSLYQLIKFGIKTKM